MVDERVLMQYIIRSMSDNEREEIEIALGIKQKRTLLLEKNNKRIGITGMLIDAYNIWRHNVR